MHRAIALYSGGLDSLLAVIIVKSFGIEIVALNFFTGFTKPIDSKDRYFAEKFGFRLKELDIREKFLPILKNPKKGYGKNLNPCIDCKILFLKEAKNLMKEYEASFIITGEVLWQRPMTQKKDIIFYIEKEAGLKGLILRPLSAKLLPPTKPELEGIVNRELLYDFWGRGRKKQLSLCKNFGIEDIPQAAGGCLLTDPQFCKKVKDLLFYDQLTIEQVELLKIGKHFRLSQKCKVIVGKNEEESKILLGRKELLLIYPLDFKGPVLIISGEYSEEDVEKACKIGVYYSKRQKAPMVIKKEGIEIVKEYNAMEEKEIVKYRI